MSEDYYSQPYTHYGASKLAQTLMGLAFSRQGRPVVMVRAASIASPGLPETLVLGRIAKQLDLILRSILESFAHES